MRVSSRDSGDHRKAPHHDAGYACAFTPRKDEFCFYGFYFDSFEAHAEKQEPPA
jgi:hypothetical protein